MSIKKEEMRLRKEANKKKIAELEAILKFREQMKDRVCKDYFNERHRVQEEETPNALLKDKLQLAQGVLKQKLENEKHKLETETSYKTDLLQSKTNDFNNRFRGKAQKKEKQLDILKYQYEHLQGVYAENIRVLERELNGINGRRD